MNSVVVVLTCNRDPLLYLCLEAIRKQDSEIPIVLISDRGHKSEDLVRMSDKFNCDRWTIPEHSDYGNSFAVFMAMFRGLSYEKKFLHFIEDDTIIHPGYLEYAERTLSAGRYDVCLGRIPGDPPSTWYESPCVSWNAEALGRCLSLIPPGYVAAKTREEMQKIVDAAFPDSKYRFGSAEQDGFFLRALEKFKMRTAFPPKSFASHIGWWGYNRPPGTLAPQGSFEEQVSVCRAVLNDKKIRTEWFGQRITESEMGGMEK